MNVAGEGWKELGILVWWGQFMARITPEALGNLCDAEGLSRAYLPPPPDADKAFRRAAKAAQGLEGEGADADAVRVELVFKDSIEITYGLLEPVSDKIGRRKTWRQFARVTWLPEDGKVITDSPEHPTVRKIVDLIPQMLANYITPDLHKVVNAVMRAAGAVPMVAAVMADGEKRGVKINSRFVPASARAEVEALGRVLKQVPGAGMEAIVVPDDPAGLSRGTVARAAEFELGGLVVAAEGELVEFTAKIKDGGIVRGTTLLDRCEKLAELSERTTGLAEQLRFRADDLLARIETASAGLAALL